MNEKFKWSDIGFLLKRKKQIGNTTIFLKSANQIQGKISPEFIRIGTTENFKSRVPE
jgi:hypothetical protein